jgi:hypothetical protein
MTGVILSLKSYLGRHSAVAGVALDVDDIFAGVYPDVDAVVSVSCNGYVADDSDSGDRHYCLSAGQSWTTVFAVT